MFSPEVHPFWRLTAELGANCSATTTSETTHVIGLDRGTDKARWAKQQGKFLVHPSWVEAAQYLWCRPREGDFPVGDNNSLPHRTSFAKTVDVVPQSRPETRINGDLEALLTQSAAGVEIKGDSVTDSVTDELKPTPKNEEIHGLVSLDISNHLDTPPPPASSTS